MNFRNLHIFALQYFRFFLHFRIFSQLFLSTISTIVNSKHTFFEVRFWNCTRYYSYVAPRLYRIVLGITDNFRKLPNLASVDHGSSWPYFSPLFFYPSQIRPNLATIRKNKCVFAAKVGRGAALRVLPRRPPGLLPAWVRQRRRALHAPARVCSFSVALRCCVVGESEQWSALIQVHRSAKCSGLTYTRSRFWTTRSV